MSKPKKEPETPELEVVPASTLTVPCDGHTFEHTLPVEAIAEMRLRGHPDLLVGCPTCGKHHLVSGAGIRAGTAAAVAEAKAGGGRAEAVAFTVSSGDRADAEVDKTPGHALPGNAHAIPEPPPWTDRVPDGEEVVDSTGGKRTKWKDFKKGKEKDK